MNIVKKLLKMFNLSIDNTKILSNLDEIKFQKDVFKERKFRESRDKNNKLTFFDNKEQKKLISHLPLEEV